MKFNFVFFKTIKGKIALMAFVGIIVCISLFAFISIRSVQKLETEVAIQNAMSISLEFKNQVKSRIEAGLDATSAISSAFSTNCGDSAKLSRTQAIEVLRKVLLGNPDFLGTYTLWEPDKFDSKDLEFANTPYHDATGRFIPYWVHCDQNIDLVPITDYDRDEKRVGSYYYEAKNKKEGAIIDPYYYKACGDKQTFMMSCISPIVCNNQYQALVGVDFEINWLQKTIQQHSKDLYNGLAKATIISGDGTIAATSIDTTKIGKQSMYLFKNYENIIANKTSNSYEFFENVLYIYSPIAFKGTDDVWLICITIPKSIITDKADSLLLQYLLIGLLIIIIFMVFVFYAINKIVEPIHLITQRAKNMAIGIIDEQQIDTDLKEIQDLNFNFLELTKSMKSITNVCKSIAEGNYNQYALVKSDKDLLALSVNKMIDNLKLTAQEDVKRNWSTNGLAQFADLIRKNLGQDNLYITVLSELIKYVKASQGALFLVTEQEGSTQKNISLRASYAFGKEKHIKRIIQPGEGLAGQVYLEKKLVFLKKVPADYIKIGSGLGDALPRCVLVVPLMYNESVEGVLEIASFNIFEDYEISFLEKIAESLASTFASIKINDKTKRLLAESTQQAEEMRSQEEEMRQNMEELLATQEEVARKEREYLNTIETLSMKIEQLERK